MVYWVLFYISLHLRTGLLLLLLVKCKNRNSSNLCDLKPNSGNISHSVSRTSETRNQNFVILIYIVQTTISWYEGSDLLTILNKLYTDALTDSAVRLFGLNSDLLKNNSLSHGCSSHRISLHSGDGILLAVLLIVPPLCTTVASELTSGTDSIWLSHN